MEALERQRSDWSRTTFFIDAEVSLSQEVFAGSALLNLDLPTSCNGMNKSNLKFALRLRPDLPLIFYSLEDSRAPWLQLKSLFRCGPAIDENGSYIATSYGSSLLIDGLNINGFSVDKSTQKPPRLIYTMALRGNAQTSFLQQTGSSGRAVPAYVRPDSGKICTGLTPPSESVGVICNGAAGSASVNNMIEHFGAKSAILNGVGGNNRLLGTIGADNLSAGSGDDVFLGLEGNDTINGGHGYNRYVPGPGNDVIIGGAGVDAVFFKGTRSQFSISSGCKKSSCSVSSPHEGSDSLSNVDVLLFDDDLVFVD
jgi:Ca2+-binding RTX toxin-like protein